VYLVSTTKAENKVKGRLLLDVVISEGVTILKLLTSKDKTLLIRRDTFLILDLSLHIVNAVTRLDLKSDGLTSESLDEDLHTTTKAENKVKGGLLLNVVISEGVTILKLLTGENETLLIRRDTFLVLDLGLHIVNAVTRLDLKGDSLASESLDEDLHTTTKAENKVKGGLLLNVVISEGVTILKLLTGENETLLIRRDTFLVLDLGLHVIDRISRLNLKGDSLASESLDEDLHTTTKAENKVEGRLLLDVVISEGVTILKLLTGEDKTLLIRRDTFLVLDLSLHVIDRISRLNLKSDGLSSKSLYKNLHFRL